MPKKLTRTYVKRTLRPNSYWLATSGGSIEDIVFHVPTKPIQITLHLNNEGDKRTLYVTSKSGIKSCCPYSKITKVDPIILFLSDVLIELNKEKFKMMCSLFSHEDSALP